MLSIFHVQIWETCGIQFQRPVHFATLKFRFFEGSRNSVFQEVWSLNRNRNAFDLVISSSLTYFVVFSYPFRDPKWTSLPSPILLRTLYRRETLCTLLSGFVRIVSTGRECFLPVFIILCETAQLPSVSMMKILLENGCSSKENYHSAGVWRLRILSLDPKEFAKVIGTKQVLDGIIRGTDKNGSNVYFLLFLRLS